MDVSGNSSDEVMVGGLALCNMVYDAYAYEYLPTLDSRNSCLSTVGSC